MLYDRRMTVYESIQRLCASASRLCAEMSKLRGHPSPMHSSQTESIFSTILYWILEQEHPPSAQRLSEVVSIMRSPSNLQNAGEALNETSSNACVQCTLADWWGFLMIESDMTVQFTCATYRQYFCIKQDFIRGEMLTNMDPDEEIAKKCLRHIWQHAPHHLFQEPTKCRMKDCPKCGHQRCAECQFSFIHWHKHYLAAESESSSLPLVMHELLQAYLCRQHNHIDVACTKLSPDDMNKALQITVKFDMKVIARTYLEMGADPNAHVSPLKETALHVAAAANVSRSMIQLLLERGADVEALDAEGKSPLHIAASSGSVNCALLLIESGANMNSKTAEGYESTRNGQGRRETKLQECEYHISDIYDPSNWSDGKWLSAALASEVDWWVIDRLLCLPDGKHPPCQPMEPMGQPISGLTPLHIAASSSQYFVIAALVANGADVHEKTAKPTELTALDIAVRMRNDGIAALLKCCSIFRPQLSWINPFLGYLALQERPGEDAEQQHKKNHVKSCTTAKSTKVLSEGGTVVSCISKKDHRKISSLSHNDLSLQSTSESIPLHRCWQTSQGKGPSNNSEAYLQTIDDPPPQPLPQTQSRVLTLFQTPPPSRYKRDTESPL